MQVELLINPNIAHADPCGRNIEKNTWSKNKDGYSNSTVLELYGTRV